MDREMQEHMQDHWAVSPPSSPMDEDRRSVDSLDEGLPQQGEYGHLVRPVGNQLTGGGSQEVTAAGVDEMPESQYVGDVGHDATPGRQICPSRRGMSLRDRRLYRQGASIVSQYATTNAAPTSSSLSPAAASPGGGQRRRTRPRISPIDPIADGQLLLASQPTASSHNGRAQFNNTADEEISTAHTSSRLSRSSGLRFNHSQELASAFPLLEEFMNPSDGTSSRNNSAPARQRFARAPYRRVDRRPVYQLESDSDYDDTDDMEDAALRYENRYASRYANRYANQGNSEPSSFATAGRPDFLSAASNQEKQQLASDRVQQATDELLRNGRNHTARGRTQDHFAPSSPVARHTGADARFSREALTEQHHSNVLGWVKGRPNGALTDTDSDGTTIEPTFRSRKRRRNFGPIATAKANEYGRQNAREQDRIAASRHRTHGRGGSQSNINVNIFGRNGGSDFPKGLSAYTNEAAPPLHSALTDDPSRVFYLAELIPRRYRGEILRLLRSCLPYLPQVFKLNTVSKHTTPSQIANFRKSNGRRSNMVASVQSSLLWRANKLPLEMFENIASHLSRDDLISMRQVNSEFEKKVSARVFKAVVVPFNPDIYAMTNNKTAKIVLPASKNQGQRKDKGKGPAINKGKGKARDSSESEGGIVIPNDRSPDGMQIFKAWGEHIKKFAMAFEVTEESMLKPPVKGLYQNYITFWGDYQWPHQQYNRYAEIEKRENLADETACMKQALSFLTSVTELGLSLDNGLGWIQGPDISDRGVMFTRLTPIFSTQYAEPSDAELIAAANWESKLDDYSDLLRTTFMTVLTSGANDNMPHLAWASGRTPEEHPPMLFGGIHAEDLRHSEDEQSNAVNASLSSDALVPNALTDGQIQWLLENGWAQKAFLSSFCISLMDNATNFAQVTTLNIAKLSSKYLSDLTRQDLWAALPSLTTVVLGVLPDWRDVVKEPTGSVSDFSVKPSSAGSHFYKMLEACMNQCAAITTLDLGWVGGGERAEGLFARNQNILPAPVLDFGSGDVSAQMRCNILSLPHVEKLTFRNCWFSPPAMRQFISHMQGLRLKTLVLNSVSLTASPGSVNIIPLNQNQAAGMNAAMQAQWNALANAPVPAQAPALNPMAAAAPGQPIFGQHGGAIAVDVGDDEHHIPCRQAPPGGHVSIQSAQQAEWAKPPSPTCLIEKPRKGSWAEIINQVTPGSTLNYKKYLHGIIEEDRVNPEIRNTGSLLRIEFVSCGYVRLMNHKTFNQDPVCLPMGQPPQCLRRRTADLKNVMMASNDLLLGSIAPAMAKHEMDTLQIAWGMRMGWEADDESKFFTREDGQPVGGSGRFSGSIAKGDWSITG